MALLQAAIISATLVAQASCYFVDSPISATAAGADHLFKLIWSYEDRRAVAAPPNSSLRLVYNHPFKLKNRRQIATFTTDFVLNLGSSTNSSAAHDGTVEAGIFAIEFDTRKSFPENHVGLDLNSVYSVLQMPLLEFGVNLSATEDVFVRAEFDGKNISIYVSLSARSEDQLKSRVIFHPLNLSVLPDEVYVGFSVSKFDSNARLNLEVKSWQFSGADTGNKFPCVWIAAGAGGLVLLSGVALLIRRILRKRKSNDLEEGYPDIEDQLQDFSIAPRVQKFEFTELKNATGNFDPKNRLGRGGFGTVYRGNLMNRDIAVKRISEDSRQGKKEFIAEVATIGGLHHKNLVKLMGWCYQNRDLLLVYEYMPNGSLDKLIFGGDDKSSAAAPNWEIRRNIICGVAEALDYLHNGCEKRVLHRDVKPSNVMLDSKFEPKLGDFGLARAIRRTQQTHHSTRGIAGTYGYMAPEIFLTRRATAETDVYAFGILVLEVVCGRKPTNHSSELSDIRNLVWEFHERGEIAGVADGRIGGQCEKEEEEIERALIVGLNCCLPNPHQRPTMKSVVKVLKGEADPPILPHEIPSFVWPMVPPSSKINTDCSLRETQLAGPLTITELVGR